MAQAPHILEWLNLAVRWFHLIAGIGWIGSSFYFMWLDSALAPPSPPKEGVEGSLWMVHSGGFYEVEKRLIGPGTMPAKLHWFKYEALFTWISGIFLLGIVYYASGGVYLIDPSRAAVSLPVAVALSLGVIAVTWFVYDGLWISKLAESKPHVATTLSCGLLFGVVFGLCQVFSGRGAFIHVGAVLGTMMVANVWVRILPAQQKMIDATCDGRKPDYSLGMRAKRRSVHNSYVTLPVIFMMLSNHYPALYGNAANWVVLSLMILLGCLVRHAMILETKGKPFLGWLWPAAGTLVAVVALTAAKSEAPTSTNGTTEVPRVADAEIEQILNARCRQCHSANPTDDVFKVAPNGVRFESLTTLRQLAPTVKMRVVETKTMPLANKTGMTDQERETLGLWLNQP